MRVLKSIRMRNQNMGRRISTKKLLNYSSISDGSGDTDDDSVEVLEDTAPLFEREIRTSPPDQAAAPIYSPRLSVVPEKETEESQRKERKRTPVEPIAPLGVVVNDDDWDSISHISGISTRTESSTPKSSPCKSMSSTDIQKDLTKLEMPSKENSNAVVSTGPDVKNEANSNTGKEISEEQAIVRTLAGARINIVVHDASSSDSKAQHADRIVRILKRFDSKDGNQSESGSKISHVFEDDQASTGRNANSNANAAPIYSEQLPTPGMVSPEKPRRVTPSFVAIFDSDLKEEHNAPPSIHRTAVVSSFDGSTATANTNNTTTKPDGSDGSGCSCPSNNTLHTSAATTPTAKTKTTPESFTDTIHETLNAIEVTMRSSCSGSPEFFESSPSCDSFLSSPSSISENLKDSLQQIKKELNGLYVSSGFASEATKAEEQVDKVQCPHSLFTKTTAEPKHEEEPQKLEMEEDIPAPTQETSFSTDGTKTVDSKTTKKSSLFSEGRKTEENNTIKTLEMGADNDDNIFFPRTETKCSF